MISREADIMYDEELDSIGLKMIIAPLIARRMAQTYIGNLLCPSWFQLWLNEGFITFFQAYIIDKVVLFLTHKTPLKQLTVYNVENF